MYLCHTNQLPLRHLIDKLDEKTSSEDGFTGPVGKLLSSVPDMEMTYDFEPPIRPIRQPMRPIRPPIRPIRPLIRPIRPPIKLIRPIIPLIKTN